MIERIVLLSVLAMAACSKDPHAVLVIDDTMSIAGDATRIGVGQSLDAIEVFDRNGASFPLTLLVVADSNRNAVGLWVDARRSTGLPLARGFALADLASDGSRTFRVELGYACEGVALAGMRCAMEGVTGLTGVCVGGTCIGEACGDGVQSGNEECDDGNSNDDDFCTNACKASVCGDGHTNVLREECDDGNSSDNDDCLATCLLNRCGDTVLNVGVETCDDGNDNPNDGCDQCRATTWTASVLTGLRDNTTLAGEMQLAAGPSGSSVIISDTRADLVYRYDTATATLSAEAGGGSGYGTSAQEVALDSPAGVAIDSDGNVYIADGGAHRVRKVDGHSGVVSVVAGSGDSGDSGDYGPAISAKLNNPVGVAVDAAGIVYIADSVANRVRQVDQSTGQIEPVAGNGVCSDAGNNGPAVLAALCAPMGLAAAADGSLYIVETGKHRLRRIEVTGTIRIYAGTGVSGFGGDTGPATSAQLASPSAVTVAADGTVYIADTGNNRVRAVDTSRRITTFAGTGVAGFSGDGGVPSVAQLNAPTGVTLLQQTLFIGDGGNHRVRAVNLAANVISTAVGASNITAADGSQPAKVATLDTIAGVELAPDGALWMALPNLHRVLRVGTDGIVTRVAGSGDNVGQGGFAGDGGQATEARLDLPLDVGFAADGDALIADAHNHRIRRIDSATGVITTIAGSGPPGDGNGAFAGDTNAATSARLSAPSAIAVASGDVIYVVDAGNIRLRRIDAGGTITTASSAFAGPVDALVLTNGNVLISDPAASTTWLYNGSTLAKAYSGAFAANRLSSALGTISSVVLTVGDRVYVDATAPQLIAGNRDATTQAGVFVRGLGRDAHDASFSAPAGVAVDSTGAVFVADDARIFRIGAGDRLLSRYAGRANAGEGPTPVAAPAAPTALLLAKNETLLMIAEDRPDGVVQCLPQGGAVTTCVGDREGYPSPLAGFEKALTTRALDRPQGLALDADNGFLYITESDHHIIRRISVPNIDDASTWTFEAYAGAKDTSGSANGALTAARFRNPSALVYRSSTRTLFVADTGNNTVRAIDTTTGQVTTFAGIAGIPGFSGDGGDASGSLLRNPKGLALATDGSLYIADTSNQRVRHVDQDGTIRTVVGTGIALTSGTGAPASAASVAEPQGIAVDGFGNLFVAGRSTVRVVGSGGDGLALGNDTTAIIYGGGDGSAYPDRITDCLAGIVVDAAGAKAYAADRCTGYVLGLARD